MNASSAAGLAGLACFLMVAEASAMTILQGPGSAVTTVDRLATFDSLTISNTSELDAYAENGLSITTANQSWGADPPTPPFVLNPFHVEPSPTAFYAGAWENLEWVTIRTTDAKPIYGLEFLYGNTWTTGDLSGVPPYSPWGRSDATLEFQEWRGGVMVDTGSQPFMPLGTVVGFYDPAGFDQLLVRATSDASGVPNSQALALDDLRVQLEPVPEAGTDAMMAAGLGALALVGRRRKLARAGLGLLLACAPATGRAAQPVLFDFNAGPQYAPLPLDLSFGGVTAHFSATGQGFSIQDTAQVIGLLPAGFSGLGLNPSSVFPADLIVEFPQTLITDFSILVAPQELATDSTATLRVTAYRGGLLVGTNTSQAAVPGTWPSSVLGFADPQGFDRVVVHYDSPPPTGGDYGPIFVADDMLVTPSPEPDASLSMAAGLAGLGAVGFRRRAV